MPEENYSVVESEFLYNLNDRKTRSHPCSRRKTLKMASKMKKWMDALLKEAQTLAVYVKYLCAVIEEGKAVAPADSE